MNTARHEKFSGGPLRSETEGEYLEVWMGSMAEAFTDQQDARPQLHWIEYGQGDCRPEVHIDEEEVMYKIAKAAKLFISPYTQSIGNPRGMKSMLKMPYTPNTNKGCYERGEDQLNKS